MQDGHPSPNYQPVNNKKHHGRISNADSNLPNEDGEKILFPRIKIWGQVDLDYLAQRINYASTFTPGDIIGLVKSLTQAIAREMGEGHSVKVDGLCIHSLVRVARRF